MNAKLKALIERPHTRMLYRQRHRVRPKVLTEKFGDGKQLVCLTPVNTRPQYYIVQVDSSIEDLNGDEFRELLACEIYEAIGFEFGHVPTDDHGEPTRDAKWPELDDSLGSTWAADRAD